MWGLIELKKTDFLKNTEAKKWKKRNKINMIKIDKIKLLELLKSKNITLEVLASELNVTLVTIYNRLKKEEFKRVELLKTKELLNIEDINIFFRNISTQEVEKEYTKKIYYFQKQITKLKNEL